MCYSLLYATLSLNINKTYNSLFVGLVCIASCNLDLPVSTTSQTRQPPPNSCTTTSLHLRSSTTITSSTNTLGTANVPKTTLSTPNEEEKLKDHPCRYHLINLSTRSANRTNTSSSPTHATNQVRPIIIFFSKVQF